jgi:hypothetical protein
VRLQRFDTGFQICRSVGVQSFVRCEVCLANPAADITLTTLYHCPILQPVSSATLSCYINLWRVGKLHSFGGRLAILVTPRMYRWTSFVQNVPAAVSRLYWFSVKCCPRRHTLLAATTCNGLQKRILFIVTMWIHTNAVPTRAIGRYMRVILFHVFHVTYKSLDCRRVDHHVSLHYVIQGSHSTTLAKHKLPSQLQTLPCTADRHRAQFLWTRHWTTLNTTEQAASSTAMQQQNTLCNTDCSCTPQAGLQMLWASSALSRTPCIMMHFKFRYK